MAKRKFQIYVRPKAAKFFESLLDRYGWTGGDGLERLLLFYRQAQMSVEGLTLDEASEEDGLLPEFDSQECEVWPLVIRAKTGEAAPCGPFEDLARVVFGGLTPVEGFRALDEEEDLTHG